MARQITVDLVSDTRQFERSMKSADTAVDRLDNSLADAGKSARRFEDGLEKADGAIGGTAEKFRGLDALASGLGATLGIEGLDAVSGYAVGLADMADGMKDLLLPALGKAKGAFAAMNATLLANPIFLVIAALAALTAAFIVAYKKSETFRNIVDGALSWVKDTAKAVLGFVSDAVVGAAKQIGKIADIITTPYQLAFKAIAKLWNSTVGGFSIPSIGFGPFKTPGFSVPKIPELAAGGPATGGRAHLVGERGPELFVPSMSGTVIPNGQIGGGGDLYVSVGGQAVGKVALAELRKMKNRGVQLGLS